MAKVKITGHASGSGVFTITAPNSNTDRTITLPDASVTLGTDATKLPLAGGTMTGTITSTHATALQLTNNTTSKIHFGDSGNASIGKIEYVHSSNHLSFKVNDAERLKLTSDGRGLSQFTAKAWARIDMESSTAALIDSHNISSLTDRGVGLGRVTFANNMANVNYTAVGNAFDGGGENDIRTLQHSNETRWRVNDFDFYTIDSSAVQDCQNATLIFFGD